MLKRIKDYLKQKTFIQKFLRFKLLVRLWFRDLFTALFWRSTRMKMTPMGFKLCGSNSPHHISMQEGTFEPEEVTLFTGLMRDCDVFVDVGANIGYYACIAKMAGKKVLAVEPLPKNLEYVFANIQGNGWTDVEVFPLGLGNAPGIATLYGGSSTGVSLIGSWAGACRLFKKTIALSTLDIILGKRFSGKRLLIKVDVEGAEFLTLCGAVETMEMSPRPVWVVEICLNEFHPDGLNPHFLETFELFWSKGYKSFTADHHNRRISREDVQRWLKNGACDSGTFNYKFVAE